MALGIATLGMDERSRAALDLVFKGPGKGAFLLADEASAQATVVDMDGPGAADLWAAYRQRFPDRPAVVLSVREPTVSGAVALRKPLRVASLLQALDEIARTSRPERAAAPSISAASRGPTIAQPASPQEGPKTRPSQSLRGAAQAMDRAAFDSYGQVIPDAPDVDLRDPEEIKRLFYSADEYAGGRVIGEIRAALADGGAREITAWNGRILVLPGSNKVLTDLSDTRLKQFALVRLTGLDAPEAGLLPFEFRVKPLRHTADANASGERPPAGMQPASVESFLWKLTAWVARGRVPVGTNPTLPVVLRHWPNFTRLLLLPNSVRIAALWMKQPRSAFNTARALKIPLSHVLTFYSAAHAIGLVTLPKRQVDFLFQPEPVAEHRRRGLLGRVLDKLGGAVGSEEP
jgi:hypothetical protein